jgi:hypothetical protein
MNIFKFNRFHLTLILGFIAFPTGIAQMRSLNYDLNSLASNNQLEVFNRKVTIFSEDGKRGIRFSKNENDGFAWVKHLIFSNGSIELDIRGKDEFQQSFVGVAFHGVEDNTYDAVYFRPFNFQSTDSVHKRHAVQYVSEPDYSWQILREKFSGKYENAIIPTPNPNEWFHVKITVKSPLITVFVNGNPEPCLSTEKLNNRASGKIGIWVGNNSDGDFANLQIVSLE